MNQSIFAQIRKITVIVLILSVVALTFLAILSIWEVLDKETLTKSIASMVMIAISSLLVIVAAMERENHRLLFGKKNSFSAGRVILLFIGLWILWYLFGWFRYWL